MSSKGKIARALHALRVAGQHLLIIRKVLGAK